MPRGLTTPSVLRSLCLIMLLDLYAPILPLPSCGPSFYPKTMLLTTCIFFPPAVRPPFPCRQYPTSTLVVPVQCSAFRILSLLSNQQPPILFPLKHDTLECSHLSCLPLLPDFPPASAVPRKFTPLRPCCPRTVCHLLCNPPGRLNGPALSRLCKQRIPGLATLSTRLGSGVGSACYTILATLRRSQSSSKSTTPSSSCTRARLMPLLPSCAASAALRLPVVW